MALAQGGPSVKRLAIVVLLAGLAQACGLGAAPSDAALCTAAHDLSLAIAVTTQASARDSAGDRVGAQQLASEARAAAEEAHATLQTITADDVRAGLTWQSLLDAYLHAGQAANALLPGFEGTYGITDDELAIARRTLETAASALPAGCTDTGATSPAAAT